MTSFSQPTQPTSKFKKGEKSKVDTKKERLPSCNLLVKCIESSALNVKSRSKTEFSPHYFHERLESLCSALSREEEGKMDIRNWSFIDGRMHHAGKDEQKKEKAN